MPGEVVLNPIFPLPLGVSTKFSFVPVVMSVVAPEKVNPVEPMILLVRVCVDARSTKVTVPEGIVALVVPVEVKVNGKAPDVVNASAKETVLALAICKVPEVEAFPEVS